jgi:hypothetical protein
MFSLLFFVDKLNLLDLYEWIPISGLVHYKYYLVSMATLIIEDQAKVREQLSMIP